MAFNTYTNRLSRGMARVEGKENAAVLTADNAPESEGMRKLSRLARASPATRCRRRPARGSPSRWLCQP